MSNSVENCLFFRDSKEASSASGIFTLLTRCIILVVVTILLSQNIHILFIGRSGKVTVSLDLTIVMIIDSVILIPLSIIMLIGIKTIQRNYCVPWLLFMAVEVVMCIITSVVLMAMTIMESVETKVSTIVISAFGLIMWAGFNMYVVLCVLSHYKVMAGTILLRHHIDVQGINYNTLKS